MNHIPSAPDFHAPGLLHTLQGLSDPALDTLPFGVIGFGPDGRVTHYNRCEAQAAHFEPARVIGQHVFIELAPCMNNYLVAGRFEDRLAAGAALDETLPWVLTFRMRPTPVQLRLLADPAVTTRYLLVRRGGDTA
jgi:photoactive yellow protein